ncbi:MAG: glycoside hydrolase family 3 N-terminal domain-containing protein [Bacteroidota bacterium]|nr:glycoside hydrolase family 3 N-terminal domain-containing protein [Bacteroidota bacterium]
MKKLIFNFCVTSLFCFSFLWLQAADPIYKNPKYSVEERVSDLLSQMSLEEKVQLLISSSDTNFIADKTPGWMGFMDNGSTPKLAAENYNRIAKYQETKTKYGLVAMKTAEGIFAYMGNGSTAFPQPLGQAAAWEPALVSSVAGVLGEEMKSRGVRLLFSPVLNMGRDPRWGRTGETYGEDPYLVSRMGVAYIKTMESKGLATTMKHFAGNTGHDGKFGASVFYSERYYREYEFPAYEAAVKEGKTQAVMMAYNTGDGIPFAQNNWMMNTYLKGELGFQGAIMSDGGGLQLIDEAYGVDTNDVDIVAKCINAGCDWGLDNKKYYKTALLQAVKQGLVTEKTISESARRTLRIMFKTGIYDNPYVDPAYAEKINDCAAHRAIALEVAKKTTVLLKNNKNTLPFSKNIKNVLVTGQLGNKLLINHYAGWGRKEVTVLEGIKNLLPNANVTYKIGAHVGFTYYPAIEPEFFSYNENGVSKQGLKAEYFPINRIAGAPAFTQTDATIDFDWAEGAPKNLDKDNFSVRWTGKIKAPYSGVFTFGANSDDGLTVYIDNKLVVDMRYGTSNSIFVEKGKFRMEKGKEYEFRAEFVEKGGKAYAKLGWDANPFVNIPAAVEAAKKADAIVAVVGMYDDENGDRAILNLDEAQEQLILELAKLEKPLAVVIQTGNVITMRRWADKVPAILHAWYPGEEGGNAIAQTIFGDNNPSAKLPITIPIETGQVPLTYNRFPGKDTRAVDRGLDKFFDVGNEPMFYFGHGLSYTSFEYSNVRISKNNISENDSISILVDIKNTGKVAGDEIVQLYVHDIFASISRPIQELKAFGKVYLAPGQTKTLELKLKGEQLKFYDINMKKIFEAGDLELIVGASSKDIRWTGLIKMK